MSLSKSDSSVYLDPSIFASSYALVAMNTGSSNSSDSFSQSNAQQSNSFVAGSATLNGTEPLSKHEKLIREVMGRTLTSFVTRPRLAHLRVRVDFTIQSDAVPPTGTCTPVAALHMDVFAPPSEGHPRVKKKFAASTAHNLERSSLTNIHSKKKDDPKDEATKKEKGDNREVWTTQPHKAIKMELPSAEKYAVKSGARPKVENKLRDVEKWLEDTKNYMSNSSTFASPTKSTSSSSTSSSRSSESLSSGKRDSDEKSGELAVSPAVISENLGGGKESAETPLGSVRPTDTDEEYSSYGEEVEPSDTVAKREMGSRGEEESVAGDDTMSNVLSLADEDRAQYTETLLITYDKHVDYPASELVFETPDKRNRQHANIQVG